MEERDCLDECRCTYREDNKCDGSCPSFILEILENE
jgi:hypothetical protein